MLRVKQSTIFLSFGYDSIRDWTKVSWAIGEYSSHYANLVGRVFTNSPGDLFSIPGHIIPKTLKMVPDNSLLNTQQYEVRIKGKVEQSRERSSGLPYTSV